MNKLNIKITKPDDWHVHLRDDSMLEAVTNCSTRINQRCIVMPNLDIPITTQKQCLEYKEKIKSIANQKNFIPLVPCYLTENLNLIEFKDALENEIFVGAKLYPSNATTNSIIFF